MIKVHDDVITLYEENPEMLDQRVFLDMELLEDLLKQYDLMEYAKVAFEEWQEVWEVSKSYWIFPDEKDLKKHVDKFYLKKNPEAKVL